MRFMMMMKSTKESEEGAPLNPKLMAAIAKHSEEARQAGILLSSGGLLPSSKGARIQVGGGKVNVIDGPFAETKELIGGFAILKANSREEAIEMGKAFMQLHVEVLGPAYEGQMEIRQMMDAPEAAEYSTTAETQTVSR
ncbi:MAG: YciI family protein [Terriglobales bacterium]